MRGHSQLKFEGPAADRLSDRLRHLTDGLEAQAHALASLADDLDRAANQLAADQHGHGIQFERIRAGLVHEAERAARAAADAMRSWAH